MRNAWGRSPQSDIWSDIRALAIWIFIVGIVGYLLFPGFFHNVYNQLTMTEPTESEDLGEITIPADTDLLDSTDNVLPDVYNSIYSGDSEISDGYWAIFVADNEFKQMSLTAESYTFILKTIDADRKAEVSKTLLLAANGKIQKYTVSEEVYGIIANLNKIKTRSGNI